MLTRFRRGQNSAASNGLSCICSCTEDRDERREYEWVTDLPLNGNPDSPHVNIIQFRIVKNGTVTYQNAWVTDLVPDTDTDTDTIVALVRAARARWKIENEGFNTLKNLRPQAPECLLPATQRLAVRPVTLKPGRVATGAPAKVLARLHFGGVTTVRPPYKPLPPLTENCWLHDTVLVVNGGSVLADALQLPADERAALAGKLIESLDGEIEEGAEAAWSVEIQRRLRRLDAGVARTVPWAEARRRILAAAGRDAGS